MTTDEHFTIGQWVAPYTVDDGDATALKVERIRMHQGAECYVLSDRPGALESHLILGVGGNVYNALNLLRWLKGGMGWEHAIKSADAAWASCDGQFGTDRWRKGQEQANRLKAALRDRVGTWLGIKGPLPA
jgi:hypothetical protein